MNSQRGEDMKKQKLLKILCVIISIVLFAQSVSVFAAWDGYVEPDDDVVTHIVDMDNAVSVQGFAPQGTASTKYTHGHQYSIFWDYDAAPENSLMLRFTSAAGDWSKYTTFETWIYSEKAYGNTFFIGLQCPSVNGTASYFRKTVKVDWTGWKRLSFPVSNFDIYGYPSLENVQYLFYQPYGWNNYVDPECELYIGEVTVTQAGKTGNASSLWDNSTREDAQKIMASAVSIYKDSKNVLVNNKVENLVLSDTSLSSVLVNNILYAPALFFKEHLSMQFTQNENSYTISCNGKKLSGTIGSPEANLSGKTITLSASPLIINEVLYFPAAIVASSLGYKAATSGGLCVIGKNDNISQIAKSEDLSGLVAYRTCYSYLDSTNVTEDDFEVARKRWVYNLVGDETLDLSNEHILNQVSKIDADGKTAHAQLNKSEDAVELFQSKTMTTTIELSSAYGKIEDMALAWGTKGTSLYHDEALAQDILYSLEWMYKNRYGQNEINGNPWHSLNDGWYYWQISIPRSMVNTMMILYDYLTDSQIENYLALFKHMVPKPSGRGSEGSNLLDSCEATIGAGILEKDIERVRMGRDSMDLSFVYIEDKSVSNGEGFYKDGSYVYHNYHPYNTGYGLGGHMASMCRILSKLSGTKFDLCCPLKENAVTWLFDGFEPLVFNGENTRMTQGRHEYARANSVVKVALYLLDIMNEEQVSRTKSMIKNQVQSDDEINSYESNLDLILLPRFLDIMSDEKVAPRNNYEMSKVYYNMDKVVHHRNDFGVGVSMSSSRIYNYESIPDSITDNSTGWYLSDGMVYIYNKNDLLQYDSVYWDNADPYRRPGTTVDDQKRAEVNVGYGNEYLSSQDFVGGVTLDNKYSVAAMALESYHSETGIGQANNSAAPQNPPHNSTLVANKAYFLFDDEVVCVGAGVKANDDANVITVVENRKLNNVIQKSESVVSEYNVSHISASGYEAGSVNVPENMLDGNLTTRWAAEGECWAIFDFGTPVDMGYAMISFASGTARQAIFDLETSNDGENWTQAFSGRASGTTNQPEGYDLNGVNARYIRFTGHGNTVSKWNSVTTFRVYPPSPDGKMEVPVARFIGQEAVTIDGIQKSIDSQDCDITDSKWVHLEGTGGYYFPQGGKIKARKVSNESSFFEMWFDHGVNPNNDSYAYVILPNKSTSQTDEYAKNADVEILVNTPQLQVVREKTLGILGLVFWQAGSYGSISVSKPMIVILEEKDGILKIAASDPTHKLSDATVTISQPVSYIISDNTVTVKEYDSKTVVNFNFENSNGKSMSASLLGSLTLPSQPLVASVGLKTENG